MNTPHTQATPENHLSLDELKQLANDAENRVGCMIEQVQGVVRLLYHEITHEFQDDAKKNHVLSAILAMETLLNTTGKDQEISEEKWQAYTRQIEGDLLGCKAILKANNLTLNGGCCHE